MQHLKQAARTILMEASLDPTYWPLAILHVSNRFWLQVAESLGIPQPVLLPFGVRLHARKRFATGFTSHWRQRTVEGRYLGQAPNTPGGHLVLVADGGTEKVLLTNTVYPLTGAHAAGKPKLRLRAKTSPHLVIKAVFATTCSSVGEMPDDRVSRFVPGGEWGGYASDSESEGSVWDSVEVRVEHGAVCGENFRIKLRKGRNALQEQQAPAVGSCALQEQQTCSPGEGHALEEQQTCSPGEGHALQEQQTCSPGEGHALQEQQTCSPGEGHALQEQQTCSPGEGHALHEQQTCSHGEGHALHEQQTCSPGEGHALHEQQTCSPGEGHALQEH